jgi:SecD/SecF fusion protein
MKLKGLVWIFAIALILISVYQLSFTWVVNSHENEMWAKAEKNVKAQNPTAKGAQRDALINQRYRRLLDSTRDVEIYPFFGTTYQKCKENELNLGLDLQGGMSVTMDVNLEGVIKSLSNNPKDPQLLAAIAKANQLKVNSEADFITLFVDAYRSVAPNNKLSGIFAGAGKEVKVTDTDDQVIAKLRERARGAIKQTYEVLVKRIDKFGVAQPNINLDEEKGVINVELAGVDDPERVRKFLQSSANLQFWEVYNIGDLSQNIETADKALQNYLNGVSATDTTAANDTTKAAQNARPLANVIQFEGPQTDNKGKQVFSPSLGFVAIKDTPKVNQYLNLDVVKMNFPGDLRFMWGVEETDEKSGRRFTRLYAIKTLPGTDRARVEGKDVEDARQDYEEGKPAIKMQMTSTGTSAWARMTKENEFKPIAIALDEVVYSAPVVGEGGIPNGQSNITGNFTVQEAQDLANILNSGKIDAPAKIVQEQIVGPTLGQEAIKGGATAFIISFLVIFILMLVYYNTSGWVANAALILNLLFTVGVLTALGATLTAAGIAGLVLTIGMAVDTNVIIFERIKDELSRGKSYQQAVNDGYRRSLPPVIDAHVTSFMTAAILMYFGLGPVLGFATTQMLGIVLSLFCGILISRLITDLFTNRNKHLKYFTSVSRRIFRNANYNFIKYRKIAYMISVVVLLLGVGAYFNGFHQGVEFKGGRSYTIAFNQNINIDDFRDRLKQSLDGDNAVLKTIEDNKHVNITTSYLKGVDNADSAVQSRIFAAVKDKLPAGTTYESFVKNHIQSSQVVQPTISDDLKSGAVKATIFAILAIFAYIFIRFRDWRYSIGTIVAMLHDVLVTLIVFSFFKEIVPFPLEIDQHFIAAILTVIGFSMNDTVIVFDRIRETSRNSRGLDKPTIINKAINDTLSRTIMTSFTVFLTILTLFIFGGEVTRGFAFAMLIGVITGTYSSIFVAAPILVDLAKDKPLGEADMKPAEKVVAKKTPAVTGR